MRRKNKILFGVLVVSVAIIILLSNFYFLLYDKSFYVSEFSKYDLYIEKWDMFLDNMFDFFKGKAELNPYFNERETSHMDDVKDVIHGFVVALQAALVVSLVFGFYLLKDKRKRRKTIVKLLIYSGGLAMLISVLFFVLSFKFEWLFVNFHSVFFKPGTWIFYEGDLLIKIFPQQFFVDFFSRVVFVNFIIGEIMLIVGVILLKFKNLLRLI
jgi:integral membrane protein (TIGR01906 family)